MCLIVFAYDIHPDYRLILAANRDEFYTRPTAPAAFWDDAPNIFAGRDLEKGGTWLGVTRDGRFAAVTNFRQGYKLKDRARSRGLLVSDFLRSRDKPGSYLEKIETTSGEYDGFNLMAGDRHDMFYFSNRSKERIKVAPGVHGLSNHLLDTSWPKVNRAKDGLARCLKGDSAALVDDLFSLLADDQRAEDARLPDTGVTREWERILSSVFIRSPDYGTRSSTVVLISRDHNVTVIERSFGADARPLGTVRQEVRGT